MASAVSTRIKHAWNAFLNQEVREDPVNWGASYVSAAPPHRPRVTGSNERSIIASVYARLGIDVAKIDIRHVRTDEDGRYLEDIKSGLQNCLTVEANLDQAATAFRQDIASTLFNEGVAAIVPVDTTLNPNMTGGYDILTLRVGNITQWFPKKVKVNLYNEETGRREEVIVPKSMVAIVYNPLYQVMNEPNSTLQRLIRKLNLLDVVDEQSSSGKLDMIIQLPYVIKSDTRRQQAEQRRRDIEDQLKGGKYGIAYTDGTEKITQLNRPAENNLMKQIEYLIALLYSQLGLTPAIMDGTADEKTMLNYYDRTVEPIVTAIVEEMKRKFLTKTARTQNQDLQYFRDPFKLVPISQLADIADKLGRNEIASANDIRQAIGWKPSKDPKADKLQNSNMPQPTDVVPGEVVDTAAPEEDDDVSAVMHDSFDSLDAAIDSAFTDLGVPLDG